MSYSSPANSGSRLKILTALSVTVSADVEKLLSGIIAAPDGRKYVIRTGQGTAVGLDCNTRDGFVIGKCVGNINDNIPLQDGQLLRVDMALVQLEQDFDIQNVITVDGKRRQLRLGKSKVAKDAHVFVACGNGEVHEAVVHNECMGVERFKGAIALTTRDCIHPTSFLAGDNCGALVVSLPVGSTRTALVHGIIIGCHGYEGDNGPVSMDVAMPLWEALQAASRAGKLSELFTESDLAALEFYEAECGSLSLPATFEPSEEFPKKMTKLCGKLDVEHGLLPLLKKKKVISKAEYRNIDELTTTSEKVLKLLKTLEDNEYENLSQFVEALHETNQSHVVEILSSESDSSPPAATHQSHDRMNVPLSFRKACQEQVLNLESEGESCDFRNVLTKLSEKKVLLPTHLEAITSTPKTERVLRLFAVIQRRPDSDYSRLCDALNETGFHDVVDTLNKSSTVCNDRRELNIVLMGETGCGKSTWINAFATYQPFGGLLEAEGASSDDLRSLWPIPITMTLDGNQTVQTGSDDNEWRGAVGESATQRPTVYHFENGNHVVNVIDTPGLHDTTGQDQDTKHVHNILTLMETVKHINAICILVNGTTNRLTESLKYCLKEILRNMDDKSAANIVFCQTFANPNKRLSDELTPVLARFIRECGLQIELTDDNVYRFDNQAIRYLVATKFVPDYAASPAERSEVSRNWNMSTESTERLLDHVSQLPSRPVQCIASIYKARRAIQILSTFVFDVACTIAQDIIDLREKTEAIEQTVDQMTPSPVSSGITDLLTMFITFRWLTRMIKVRSQTSMTVCTSPRCVTFANGAFQYTQVCHEKCTSVTGVDSMYWCCAFDTTGKCKQCGCNYKLHEWKFSRTEVVEIDIFGKEELALAIDEHKNNPAEQLKVLKKYVFQLKTHYKQLESERDVILETCARLSLFIKQHALIDERKEFDLDQVLERQLDAILQKRRESAVDAEEAARCENVLVVLKADYEEKWNLLKDEPQRHPLEVQKMIDDLYDLPLKGGELKEAAEAANSALSNGITDTRWKTVWKTLRPAKAWKFLKTVNPIGRSADWLNSMVQATRRAVTDLGDY